MRDSIRKAQEGNLHTIWVDRFTIAGRHYFCAHIEDAAGRDVTEKVTEKAFGQSLDTIRDAQQVDSLLRMARHHGRRVEVKEL